MSKPKFYGGFKRNKHRQLSLGVSLDNSQFLGHNLAVFVHLANKHIEHIDGEVLIFVGDAPYACYVGEEEANITAKAWEEQARPYLDNLKKPYRIVCWNHFTDTEKYQELAKLIQQDYRDNKDGFRDIVERVANEFIANKQGTHYTVEAATNYLLLESPVYAMLEGKSAYPKETLNDVLIHVVKKYNLHNFEYCGYNIGDGKISGNNPAINYKEQEEIRLLKEKMKEMEEEMLNMQRQMEEDMLHMQKQMKDQMNKMELFLNHVYINLPKICLPLQENENTSNSPGITFFSPNNSL